MTKNEALAHAGCVYERSRCPVTDPEYGWRNEDSG